MSARDGPSTIYASPISTTWVLTATLLREGLSYAEIIKQKQREIGQLVKVTQPGRVQGRTQTKPPGSAMGPSTAPRYCLSTMKRRVKGVWDGLPGVGTGGVERSTDGKGV